MNRICVKFLLTLAWLMPLTAFGYPPMQLFVDITPPGGVLKPPPGVYSGPVVIDKPITLDGDNAVVIDGGGQGTVLTIRAHGTVIRNLEIVNSGRSHDGVDAGILLEADNALIEGISIDDSLFGIFLKQAYDNVIRNSRISSIDKHPTLRGDGFRLWYSSDNLLENNELLRVRDLVFSNSPDNRIHDNRIRDSRMGMEFVFSPGNDVRGNLISNNSSGIVVLFSNELHIHDNRIEWVHAITSSALAIKESSQVEVDGNVIAHCSVGLIVNSPIHPENTIELHHNLFTYNDTAMYFYGEKGGHMIHDNRFEQNLSEIMVSAASSALANEWSNNYWDNYSGYDQDNDGIGDMPHEIYLYADRIWMDRPMARFYRGSPVMELIDFVERLAPFSNPKLILRDPEPRAN